MQGVIEPFELDLTVGEEHYTRSKLISNLETITVANNPVALAIREAIDKKGISYCEIQAIIAPDSLGVYFKLFQILNGETWLLQSTCYDKKAGYSLLRALQTQEKFSMKLNFQPIDRCDLDRDNTPRKMLWRLLIVRFVTLILAFILIVKGLEFLDGAINNIFLLATVTVAVSILLTKLLIDLVTGFYMQ